MSDYRIDTKCIQEGYHPGNGEPRVVPIVQSTTYTYDSSEAMGDLFDLKAEGFFYTRLGNPTMDAVEKKIAALEGGVGAMLTSSGQAASLISMLNICHAGDHVVASSAIYGGTFNLIYKTMKEMGIESTFVGPGCTREELEAAFQPNTRCVFAETLSNPSLVVTDIEMFAQEAHAHGVPLIVDNTFPTPINCRPFEFGADVVTHPPANIWTAMPCSWGALLWTAAILIGRTASSPYSPSPMSLITVLSTRSSSAKPRILPRPAPISCGIWARRPAPKTHSC